MHFLFITILVFLSLIAPSMGAVVIRATTSSSIIPSSSVIPSSSHSSSSSALPSPTASTAQSSPTFRAKARVFSPNATVRAYFDISGYADGRGTYVKVEVMAGLDVAGGPYSYHVHTNPVPSDGNCTMTMGHLDPLAVGDNVVCDGSSPQNCEEGDLSGKHGKMNGTEDGTVNAFGYTDEYLRFFPQGLSILGRSIVIHDHNKTRIACGNITSTLDGTMDADNQPTDKASTYVTQYSTSTTGKTNTTLPVSIARPALSIKQALFVNLTMVQSTVTMNGTQTVVDVPTLVQINGTIPFNMTA